MYKNVPSCVLLEYLKTEGIKVDSQVILLIIF